MNLAEQLNDVRQWQTAGGAQATTGSIPAAEFSAGLDPTDNIWALNIVTPGAARDVYLVISDNKYAWNQVILMPGSINRQPNNLHWPKLLIARELAIALGELRASAPHPPQEAMKLLDSLALPPIKPRFMLPTTQLLVFDDKEVGRNIFLDRAKGKLLDKEFGTSPSLPDAMVKGAFKKVSLATFRKVYNPQEPWIDLFNLR